MKTVIADVQDVVLKYIKYSYLMIDLMTCSMCALNARGVKTDGMEAGSLMNTHILDYEVPPRWMQGFHLIQVLLWTIMIPIVLLTGLKDSVPFLVVVSILALVFSELAAWQASLAERKIGWDR